MMDATFRHEPVLSIIDGGLLEMDVVLVVSVKFYLVLQFI